MALGGDAVVEIESVNMEADSFGGVHGASFHSHAAPRTPLESP